MNRVSQSIAAVIWLGLSCTPAFAELHLDIVKPVTPVPDNVDDVDLSLTSSAHSVIDSSRLQDRYVQLDELLRQEVGVQVRRFGGTGSFSTVSLRGASSEKVMVYVDGVPFNSAAGGGVDLSQFPVSSIERIEIFRGAVPVQLGQASIGGAVNIITRKNRQGKNGKLELSSGSFGTREVSGSYGESNLKQQWLLMLNALHSDNNYSMRVDNGTSFNTLDDRIEDRNNDYVKQYSSTFNWRYQFTNSQHMNLRMNMLDKSKGIPRRNNHPDIRAYYDSRLFDAHMDFNQDHWLTPDLDASVKMYVKNETGLYNDELAQVGFINQKTRSRSLKLGSSVNARYRLATQQWYSSLGYEQESYDFDNLLNYLPDSKNRRDIVYLDMEQKSYWLAQQLIVSLSARMQQVQDNLDVVYDAMAAPDYLDDRHTSTFDPQLGLKYRFSNDESLSFNLARYSRLPSFFELFGDQGLFRGNPDLRVEQGTNTDVSYDYRFYAPASWLHDSRWSAGVFYNTIDDMIVRNYNAQGIAISDNVARAHIIGLETHVSLFPSKTLRLVLNASFTDATRDSDAANASNPIPGVYRQHYSLFINQDIQGWDCGAELETRRGMYFDSAGLLPAKDYSLLNLSALKKWKHQSLELRVNNVTGTEYTDFNYNPQPGRAYYLTYGYKF